MRMRTFLACFAIGLATVTCGRSASTLLRQGQAPVFDFPMYISEGAPGRVWKYERDRTRTLVLSGLSDPRGIASDRANNLYIVEQGANRLIKYNTVSGVTTTIADALSTPTVVAVNSFGEPFVTQDGALNVIRASDKLAIKTFTSRPSALAFGVEDLMIVGLFDSDQAQWVATGDAASVSQPVGISTDATGRVYVAEGATANARVVRYQQRGPVGETVVADSLSGIAGLAVDPVGNIYAVEQGANRVILISFDGVLYTWVSDTLDPQYLAFTQY